MSVQERGMERCKERVEGERDVEKEKDNVPAEDTAPGERAEEGEGEGRERGAGSASSSDELLVSALSEFDISSTEVDRVLEQQGQSS